MNPRNAAREQSAPQLSQLDLVDECLKIFLIHAPVDFCHQMLVDSHMPDQSFFESLYFFTVAIRVSVHACCYKFCRMFCFQKQLTVLCTSFIQLFTKHLDLCPCYKLNLHHLQLQSLEIIGIFLIV